MGRPPKDADQAEDKQTPSQPIGSGGVVVSPETGRRLGHRIPYDPDCPVCKDPARPEMEQLYAAGEPWETLLEWAESSYSKRDIERHMRALDLDIERAKATYRVMAIMMAKGLERIEAGLEPVTPDHLLKLIPHIDKREGRIIEHVKVDQPRQIVINSPHFNLPIPGAREEDPIPGRLAPNSQGHSQKQDVNLLFPPTVEPEKESK